jgi:hypothetical protein
LTQRAVLADFEENHQLMLAASEPLPATTLSLAGRPRIRVAMYWGIEWRGKMNLPDSTSAFLNQLGVQGGAFYPAFRKQPAVWVFGASTGTRGGTRRLSEHGLAILARHRIPTQIR